MNRRNFFRTSLGVVGALPAVAFLANHLPEPVRRYFSLHEIAQRTIRNNQAKIAKSITDNNALLAMLKQKGRLKHEP